MSEEQLDEEAVATEQPPEQAAEVAATPPAENKQTMTKIAGVSLDDAQFPQFVVLVASIVLMIALGAHYDWKNTGVSSYDAYAISVASIAMILSFFGLLLAKFKQDLYKQKGMPINMLCFLYSFVGACFLTFDKPFSATGNGYFAAWVLVCGSAMTLGVNANALGSTVKGFGALMGLLASSLVVVIASIPPILDDRDKNEAIFAIVLGCVSFVFALLALGMDKKGRGMPGMGYFGVLAILAICWVIAACIVTFRGPFEQTGNGYFGSWAAAAASSMAAFAAKKAM